MGRWDLEARQYEPGAWLRGRVFPRRSDLSLDGRWLCYFAQKPNAGWEHGDTYVALSRLPWLTALHAFSTCGTWTRGYHFTADAGAGHPEGKLPIPWGLEATPAVQFATERRRGWNETPDSPQRDPRDAWDERRNARLRKPRPGGGHMLHVESVGQAGGEFGVEQAVDGLRVDYWLETKGDIQPLVDLQWADWDAEGRLLAATRSGLLQIRQINERGTEILFEEDLSPVTPDPRPAPSWAHQW